MARVMNEFLVSNRKGWYHLEMMKLVCKGSRQAAPTTTQPAALSPEKPVYLLAGVVCLLTALFQLCDQCTSK